MFRSKPKKTYFLLRDMYHKLGDNNSMTKTGQRSSKNVDVHVDDIL